MADVREGVVVNNVTKAEEQERVDPQECRSTPEARRDLAAKLVSIFGNDERSLRDFLQNDQEKLDRWQDTCQARKGVQARSVKVGVNGDEIEYKRDAQKGRKEQDRLKKIDVRGVSHGHNADGAE